MGCVCFCGSSRSNNHCCYPYTVDLPSRGFPLGWENWHKKLFFLVSCFFVILLKIYQCILLKLPPPPLTFSLKTFPTFRRIEWQSRLWIKEDPSFSPHSRIWRCRQASCHRGTYAEKKSYCRYLLGVFIISLLHPLLLVSSSSSIWLHLSKKLNYHFKMPYKVFAELSISSIKVIYIISTLKFY